MKSALSDFPAKSIVRWRKDRPISPMNLIPVTNKERKQHIESGLDQYSKETIERIDDLLLKLTQKFLEKEDYLIQ